MEKIHTMFSASTTFIKNHKRISIIGGIVVVAILYYFFGRATPTPTRYVTTTVTKGTVVSSVSGSGQVSASNQIDLKPKVSGDITYIGVKAGDTVKKGKLLFSINARSAEKSVRDAETSLAQAKLALAKLQEPADTLSVIQAQNAIEQAKADKISQQLSLQNSHRAFLNSSPEAVPATGTSDYTAPIISGSYVLDTEGEIDIKVYNSGGTPTFTVSGLTSGTGVVTTTTTQPIGNSGLYIKFPSLSNIIVTDWVITLPNKKASNYLSNYNSYQTALANYQQAIASDDRTITENTEKLKQLQAGSDAIDLQTKQLAVTQAENALVDAKQNLNDYYIVAPFDGVIATVDAQLGQPAGSTALGTIITNQKIAEISLNEVDVAKIQLGQKVTLTFDAIDGLSIAGEVASIDAVGTVSSGVVTYTVKIDFATNDDRIKPGMSVSSAIINGVHQDVLAVPNSAVKNKNGISYVEVFDAPLAEPVSGIQGSPSSTLPKQVTVETGLSNDTVTEITSGLTEGMIIVSRTITATTTAAATAPSLLGNTRGATGATRAATGR